MAGTGFALGASPMYTAQMPVTRPDFTSAKVGEEANLGFLFLNKMLHTAAPSLDSQYCNCT